MSSISDFVPCASRMASSARIFVYLSCAFGVTYSTLIPLNYQSDEASLYNRIGCTAGCMRFSEVVRKYYNLILNNFLTYF